MNHIFYIYAAFMSGIFFFRWSEVNYEDYFHNTEGLNIVYSTFFGLLWFITLPSFVFYQFLKKVIK